MAERRGDAASDRPNSPEPTGAVRPVGPKGRAGSGPFRPNGFRRRPWPWP